MLVFLNRLWLRLIVKCVIVHVECGFDFHLRLSFFFKVSDFSVSLGARSMMITESRWLKVESSEMASPLQLAEDITMEGLHF